MQWSEQMKYNRNLTNVSGAREYAGSRADCRSIHAIEYQGGAHYKGAHATAARDAVKKEALRRAGIGYVEVVAGDTPAELRRVVERLVQGV